MNTKNLRYLQRPGAEKKCKYRQLNPEPKKESSHTPRKRTSMFLFHQLAKAEFKSYFSLPLFRSIRSSTLQRNDAKDNPTRTFCPIYIKRDVSTSKEKLRLHYCFQNKERFFESEWTKGFFGKADKTINKLAVRMNLFHPDEPIRA